jgi:hypothetical protein
MIVAPKIGFNSGLGRSGRRVMAGGVADTYRNRRTTTFTPVLLGRGDFVRVGLTGISNHIVDPETN